MRKLFTVSKFVTMFLCILFLWAGAEAQAAPGNVVEVKQVGASSGSVTISWLPPEDAYGFQLDYCENEDFSDGAYTSQFVGAQYNSAKIEGLLSGKSYYVRISASDLEGNWGMPSDVLEVVTVPTGNVANVKQTDAGEKSVTFSWDKCDGANAYQILWWAYSRESGSWESTYEEKVIGDVQKHTLSGLKNVRYYVRVYPARQSANGYLAWSGENTGQNMYTLPRKVTGVKILITGSLPVQPLKGVVNFDWNCEYMAEGYQYVIYGSNNKKRVSGTTRNYANVKIEDEKLTNDQFMKIKVRGYRVINGQKKYGKWSDDCYFAKRPKSVKFAKVSGGGFRMSWTKMKGAQSYTIYASAKQKTGYKKLGTTSKNFYQIKKVNGRKLVSNKVYFFKLIANKKVGKKTVHSDGNWYLCRIY